MLKALFEWLDRHPESYWLGASVSILLLTGWVWTAVRREAVSSSKPQLSEMIGDGLILLAFLFAWRWPYLLVAYEFNPDESQIIAGGLTLAHDPVFWRAVDGMSSGPLNYYVLLVIQWLGAPLDFFTARVLGLLLAWAGVFMCLRLLTDLFGRAIGRLAILPAASFFATVTAPDFVHYSSEHVALAMIAGAAWLLARQTIATSPNPGSLEAACFIAGAAPWAKLQTAPISVALIGWALWLVWRTRSSKRKEQARQAIGPFLAAISPTLVALLAIAATGQLDAAVRRYFLHNILYVAVAPTHPEPLRHLWHATVLDGSFPLFIGAVSVSLIAPAVIFVRGKTKQHPLWLPGCALTAAAFAAVVVPRREFLHYLLLLIVPMTIWLGAAAGGFWQQRHAVRQRRVLIGAMFTLGAVLPITARCVQPEPFIFGEFSEHWRRPRSAEAAIARAFTGPSEPISVWGWASYIHVESGRAQGTRDAQSQWSITPNAQIDYHRACWLSDFERSRSKVFVDAVGPGSLAYWDRETEGHEIFPALADHIRQHYELVVDLGHARVFVRTDIPPMPREELNRLVSSSRLRGPSAAWPDTLSPSTAARADVGKQVVQMLLPPAEMTWKLTGTERALSVEYGFHPRSYRKGRSDGAELIMELRTPEKPPQRILNRHLDPQRRKDDRGLQKTRLTLPPFERGSSLVIRTTAGEFDDNAWDWLYVASARFDYSPFYTPQQFPGFSRVPDSVDFSTAYLVGTDGESLLMTHAPATLSYVMEGTERVLRFGYGFASGAYSDGGQTDGATYRVELHRPNEPVQLLFARHCQPSVEASHRGRQHAELVLPAIQTGDRLQLSIDSGARDAWDWTYLTEVALD